MNKELKISYRIFNSEKNFIAKTLLEKYFMHLYIL